VLFHINPKHIIHFFIYIVYIICKKEKQWTWCMEHDFLPVIFFANIYKLIVLLGILINENGFILMVTEFN